eukprot:6172703-Pleurochrysis_carterae.AAC.1
MPPFALTALGSERVRSLAGIASARGVFVVVCSLAWQIRRGMECSGGAAGRARPLRTDLRSGSARYGGEKCVASSISKSSPSRGRDMQISRVISPSTMRSTCMMLYFFILFSSDVDVRVY